MKPDRIQLSRKKGWRLPPNTVNCARPGKWGNPFPVNKERNAFQAVREFEHWLLNTNEGLKIYSKAKQQLRGKNLACWCAASPCHCDVLLEIANRQRVSTVPPSAAGPSST
jgi:hypothetical protein